MLQQSHPDSMKSWGTFCEFRKDCTAAWVGVPSDPTSAKMLSCSTSLRVKVAVLAGL